MVLFRLVLDQNQGFLLHAPDLFLGVIFLGSLFAYNRYAAGLMLLVFLSLIVPNALHTNWYGGESFSGRFGWAASVVFIVRALFGFIRLAALSASAFRLTVAVLLLLQAYFFYQYTFVGVDFIRRAASTGLDLYALYYYPVEAWLPAFYNQQWAYTYAPNYAWVLSSAALLVVGFSSVHNLKARVCGVLAIAAVAIFGAGWLVKTTEVDRVYLGKDLPAQTGKIQGDSRIALQVADKPGLVSFGPYEMLRAARYQATITYRSAAPVDQAVGKFIIADATRGNDLSQIALPGTSNTTQSLQVVFEVTA